MSNTPDCAESIFAAAIALPTNERPAYLDQACTNDAALRGHVDALIRAHERAGHLLDRPVPGGPEQTRAYVSDEQPGTVVAGRYKLLEAIGEGGMGTVWVAEQTQPVRRKVALKLIKAGMDSRSVIARFEAERQALALMDHPNVAKVLDGGLTEAGRPFFVMEYFKGVPITEYCDATRLSVAERLQLFTQVCQAVQHAHQKGIIHRDLKPSNILVAPYDNRPVPKIIDFGLAKAMHQSLTEKTLHTAHDSVLGTPLYMSPEQAQLNNLDVDTRSDIYSLGVLLYELLTGTTPLEKARFKQAAWDEIRRIIREEEPPRPSARLSSTKTLPSLAACRQAEPLTLTRQVRGELDWIVMKALAKERERRYETASSFAKDIERFLNREPVQAAPPGAGYRIRKFVERNRGQVIAALLVLIALLAGIAGTTVGLIRAEQQRKSAEANEQKANEAAEAERRAREREELQRRNVEETAERLKISEKLAQSRLADLVEAQHRETEARVHALLPDETLSDEQIAYLQDQAMVCEDSWRLRKGLALAGRRGGEAYLEAEALARMHSAKARVAWALGDAALCLREYEAAISAADHWVAALQAKENPVPADSITLAGAQRDLTEFKLCASRVRRRILGRDSNSDEP